MSSMNKWSTLASKEDVEKTIESLKSRNIEAIFVEKDEIKEKVLSLLPKNSRVLASTSVTLEETGIKQEIDDSGNYVSVRKEYMSLDQEKDADKIRILRFTPDIVVGSVHAVTKDGQVIIASNTGSQLAPYVSSAGKVIWVVGTQKIVNTLDDGLKRLNEYVVPLEDKHMEQLYGVHTNVSKLLIFNKEVAKGRVTLVFVNAVLGF